MIIRLEALHLAANTARQDEESRYFLCALQVRADGAVVVTNGHYAMRMRSAAQGPSLFDEIMDRGEADQETDLLIEAGEAKAFYDASKKLITKGRESLPVHVTVALRAGQVKVATADGLVSRRFDIKHDEERIFPEIDKVIPAPKPNPEDGIVLDLDYLYAIVKTLRKLRCTSIRLELGADTISQVRFSASAPAGEIDGAIMPMRTGSGADAGESTDKPGGDE